MSTQSGQGNLNKLTQQLNLSSADQQLSSQSPAPYVVNMDASSVASEECSTENWGFNLSTDYIRQLTLSKLFDDDDAELIRLEFGSMAQTRGMNPNWESSSTPTPALEDGEGIPNANVFPQRFNSHHNSEGDVDDGAQSFEPDQDLTEEASRVTPMENVGAIWTKQGHHLKLALERSERLANGSSSEKSKNLKECRKKEMRIRSIERTLGGS
ncbi:uncharacterized protein LOC120210163 [Hibiscus syriacus]|uniref:uncharacterized protein LOC120210163 n=1 Tax=Hibiscus syriacus TaxID=106335 RepID=UPI0019247452|nr:uncharacterized protein LOC120210163 [Hibiscus syriacus]